jgi:hypothetical protein
LLHREHFSPEQYHMITALPFFLLIALGRDMMWCDVMWRHSLTPSLYYIVLHFTALPYAALTGLLTYSHWYHLLPLLSDIVYSICVFVVCGLLLLILIVLHHRKLLPIRAGQRSHVFQWLSTRNPQIRTGTEIFQHVVCCSNCFPMLFMNYHRHVLYILMWCNPMIHTVSLRMCF